MRRGSSRPRQRSQRTKTSAGLDRAEGLWDADKAAQNLRKHGVQFSVAARAFFDPYRIEVYDEREDYREDRWATIGYAAPALLYVVYTVRSGGNHPADFSEKSQ